MNDTQLGALIGVGGTLAGTILGVLLGWVSPWWTRKKRLKAHWGALRAEMTLCTLEARRFLNEEPLTFSPLYRLPVVAQQISYPALLADGDLSEAEALRLGKFFAEVQEFNRGLDNEADVATGKVPGAVGAEHQRNLSAAHSVCKDHDSVWNMVNKKCG